MDSLEEKSYNFALVTLKERCHFLKEQLKTVDDENIKLKVQLANLTTPKNEKPMLKDSMIEKVEVLTKQKNQLSNQVHILATENSNMWLRMSKLSVVNKTLNYRLNQVSSTLHQNGSNTSISEKCVDVSSDIKDCRKNIEDLSLKLISDIKLDKTELEKQYAQMVALHNPESYNATLDLGFTSYEGDEDSVSTRIRRHALRLNSMKQKLIQQQALFLNTLDELKKANESNALSASSKSHFKDVATLTDVQLDQPSDLVKTIVEVNANEIDVRNDQVCPLCGTHVPGTIESFCDHVSNHMDDS